MLLPRSRSLESSSLGLAFGKLAQMGLGFIFWMMLARFAPPAQVGLSGALVSAINLVAQLALLGFGAALITHLPSATYPNHLISLGLLLVLGVALVGAVLAVVAAHAGMTSVRPLITSAFMAEVFIAASALCGMALLMDNIAMASHHGHQVLVRNVIAGLVGPAALGLVIALGRGIDVMIAVISWTAGWAVIFGTAVVQLHRRGFRFHLGQIRSDGRLLFDAALPNYLLTIAERVPALVIPLLVVRLLSPEANAYWYVIWQIAWAVYVLPLSVGTGLFAEGRRNPEGLVDAATRALRLSLAGSFLGAALIGASGPMILSLAGKNYGANGLEALRILLLGVIPMSVCQAYYSLCRTTRRLNEASLAATLTAVLVCAAVVAAARSGSLASIAWAWATVQGVAAVVALVRLRVFGVTLSGVARLPRTLSRPITSFFGRAPRPRMPVHVARRARRLLSTSVSALKSSRLRTPSTDRRPRAIWGASIVLAMASASACLFAAGRVRPERIGPMGLAPLLPPVYWVSLTLLTLVFCALLARRATPRLVLACYVVAQVLCVHGPSFMVYGAARLHVAFRHAGIIENLIRTGSPNRSIDAYFSWPGFFSVSTLVTEAGGLSSAVPLIRFAPLVFNLGYAFALYVLLSSRTTNRWLVWIPIWIFCAANWVDQDYFSPQAAAYLIYITVLALIVGDFDPLVSLRRRKAAEPPREELLAEEDAAGGNNLAGRAGLTEPRRPMRRDWALYLVAIMLCAAVVPAHQLTPFALLVSLTALTLIRRSVVNTVPLTLGVLILGWAAFAAYPYFAGHLLGMIQDAGLAEAASTNVVNRLHGDPHHQIVVQVRLAITAFVWALAAVGYLRRAMTRRKEWSLAVLAASPFVLLPLQPYGGEMLLRVYLFSLPFVSFGAALAMVRGWALVGRWRPYWLTVAPVLLLALTVGGVFVHYGNDQVDVSTQGELAAVEAMYDAAQPGAILVAGDANTPMKQRDYEKFRYELITRVWNETGSVDEVLRNLKGQFARRTEPSYVLITRGNINGVRMFGSMPVDALETIRNSIQRSPDYRQVPGTRDAWLFEYVGRLSGSSS